MQVVPHGEADRAPVHRRVVVQGPVEGGVGPDGEGDGLGPGALQLKQRLPLGVAVEAGDVAADAGAGAGADVVAAAVVPRGARPMMQVLEVLEVVGRVRVTCVVRCNTCVWDDFPWHVRLVIKLILGKFLDKFGSKRKKKR